MQHRQPETVTLDDILMTEELSARSPRPANLLSENQALHSLARQMANPSTTLLQNLVDMALDLCSAGTAGVSLLESTDNGEEVFRWAVLAGRLAQSVGGTIPRNFSPCGVCLERGTPVLFSHPDRYFTDLQAANAPIVEGLVLPLVANDRALGTIWIISHDEQRQFDAEDVRVMTSLADFTATAVLLQQCQTKELLAANTALETEVVERKQAEERSRALVSNLPGGAAFVVDRDLRYLLAEGEALAIAGFKPEDFVGRTIFEALPPELATSYEPRYRQALAGEPFEDEHHTHDRTYISRGTPLRAENGEIYAVLVVSYDITERKRTEAATAQDLKDTQLLRDLSARLVTEGNIQALYQEIMAAAIALTRADAGTVQILDEATQDLLLLATQGFERDLTDHFYRVNASSNTSCGMALRNGDRTFVDFDVPESEDPDGSMRIHVEAGYLSAQSTPLVARSGKAIGMVSTHWRKHHRPTEGELRFLDLLARQAADLIEQRQVANALHESEEKYRSLFNSMDEAYAVVEVMTDDNGEWNDFLFLEVNPAFVKQTGMEYPVGRKATELLGTPNPRWAKVYGQVAETGEPIRFEEEEATLGRVFDLYVFRLGGVGSRRVAVLFTDITDRKHREANLTFLADLMNDLSSLTTVEDVMERAGKRITEHLNLSRYMFVEIFPEAGTCTYLLPSHPPGQLEISGSFILAEYHTEEEHRLLCTGHSMIVNDIRDGTRTPEQIAAFEAFDIASIVNTPYLSNGRWVFDLGVARSKPSVWREDEIELLRELSARIWLRIERARAEASLRKSEAKYRSLFNSINEGFHIIELIDNEAGEVVDYRFLESNPAFERQTGLKNTAGKLGSEIAPQTESYWLEAYDRVARTGEPLHIENYNEDTDRWYSGEASRVGGAGSRQVAILFSDITERKRAEQQLRRAAEMDAYRVKLSDALRSLSDPIEIQSVAMRVFGEHLQVDRVLYSEVDRDDETIVIHDNYVRQDVPKLIGRFPISNFTQSSEKLGAGQCLIISDVAADPEVAELDRASLLDLGIRATLVVPLTKGDRWVVSLGVHHMTPRAWSEDDIAIQEETADRTWAAVERARAEAAMRESELQRVQEQAAREQEHQRAEALAELDRAKTLFFSNISHEFRTPLTLLLAPLQDALSDVAYPLASPHRERLELAQRNANRLLKLVNTLLDFSRIEAGRMEAVYEPTDLAMFTTELASVFRSAIERAGLRLIVDCPPLPEPVYVDREMWEKIILNLLSNAFKFTLEGEITVKLHSADNHQIVLEIQDTGIGIAPEHLPHLFERFYQVRGVQARTYEGSGIGLALVHELIRLHGGSIEVSSTVGQGTCFTIALSFGTAHLPSDRLRSVAGDRSIATRTLASTTIGAAPYVEEVERWLLEDGETERRGDGETGRRGDEGEGGDEGDGENIQSKIRSAALRQAQELRSQRSQNWNVQNPNYPKSTILLVDDNADMRDYLTRILSDRFQVAAFADGTSALAAATECVPDLVLADVMMPGLDGFELLKALRADPRTREIPIVLLSARAGEEAAIEGLEAGADDYLIKPFSARELISRVNAHLQMARLRGEALDRERTLNRKKDELLSTVSHELNAPLVAILGWTRLLRENPPSQSILMKALETIERNAMLQAKLVRDLLDLSRISAGKLHLKLEPVELESVVEVAIASVAQTAATKGIDLVWQNNRVDLPRNSGVVMGDRDRLGQIVNNLLTNAIKFTPQGGQIEVRLASNRLGDSTTQNSNRYAQISVTDTGIGISADFLPHIFERFRQAESLNSAKGLGLGLAIARHLVELHGGTIQAASPGIGQGATFIVKLPLLPENIEF